MSVRPLLLALLATVIATTSCSDGGEPATTGTAAPSRQTPGDPATTWRPPVPGSPADPVRVTETYDVVLDAAVESAQTLAPTLEWSASTTRTEEFEGTCAITLERTAPGPVPPPGDDTLDLSALSAALEAQGFGALAMADDPGGALRYLALAPDGALFELRSKGTSTVAVRVPTTADACS